VNGEDQVSVNTGSVWPEDAEDEEGLVINWFVSEESQVEEGDPLCEFQVEKVDVEVPAPVTGTIEEIILEEDAEFERGDTLAYIATK
jgi:pyruvate/2-oxoglutarate dehydrogenase complex dihydrolipoamide acyltransferase (E2) component